LARYRRAELDRSSEKLAREAELCKHPVRRAASGGNLTLLCMLSALYATHWTSPTVFTIFTRLWAT